MQIQDFLRSGKTLDDLSAEFGIKKTLHPDLPLVILNYDQIESPKLNPIVREARALVLNSNDWSIVARSFPRFFNWGEVPDEMPLFDFSEFRVQSKEDGSLALVYFYDGKWHVNTRGSFALDYMQWHSFTWREGMCRALGVNGLEELNSKLDPKVTYICEFVSPWNKIVRRYENPQMYLLTAYQGENELSHSDVDSMTHDCFVRPETFSFHGVKDIQDFLLSQEKEDPTFEGVVICDRNFQRWKIKNPGYLSLHRLRGEGDNLYHPRHLLPFVLKGEESELLTYFPEATDQFLNLKSQVEEEFDQILRVWKEFKDIESQKEFALAINGKTSFTSILFSTRKKFGTAQTQEHLRSEFCASDHLILKTVLNNFKIS
jgi:hypothetical protein